MKQNVNCFFFFFSIYALPLLSIKSVPVCEKTFTFSFDTQSALQFGELITIMTVHYKSVSLPLCHRNIYIKT